ncbi:MAG: hypothetical protein M1530_00290, partial [Candidatus Marsarchaeota archaeon]|nr:hypothetical protein [Candidatus Marsarchaeota archaeon]
SRQPGRMPARAQQGIQAERESATVLYPRSVPTAMFEFATLALFLGIKHSFDADHIIAVSNLLSRAESLAKAARMSASWAAGHMLTAAAITALLFAFKDEFLSLVLGKMELLVAIMLIGLGLLSVWKSGFFHRHSHRHDGIPHIHWHLHLPQEEEHAHRHMFGIGIVHGLASNDELLLLLTASLGLSSLAEMIFGVAVFSAGVVIGMVAFSLLLAYPMLKMPRGRLVSAINLAVGCISVAFGAMMLFGI